MAWYARIVSVFRPQQLSDVLDEELGFHIAERIDDLIAEGMSPAEAHATATRAFGNYTVQKTRTRDVNIATRLEAILKDLQYAARQLRLSPTFTIVAVLSLALGIGANSAMFQLINALGLRNLPVPHADRLATVGGGPDFYTSGWTDGRHRLFTFAQLEQMSRRQEAFDSLMAFGTTDFNLTRGGEARYAQGLWVTPNFLEVLGVAPHVGTWVAAGTDPRDCSGAGALLHYNFWQREYAGDLAALGRDISISLNGRSFPILGVTPPSFHGVEPGQRFDVALPICADGLIAEDGNERLTNTSENRCCPPGRPDRDTPHAALASGESHSVTSPRLTKARSYTRQFPTR